MAQIILRLEHIEKSFGIDQVLRDISVAVDDTARLALVGVNGSGKSTLLKIIAGQLEPDAGQLVRLRGLTVAYLEQSERPAPGQTVLDVMNEAAAPIFNMEARLRELEHEMADAADDSALKPLADEYARLTARFEQKDGYQVRSRLQGVLRGLGFEPAMWEQEAQSLSGGEMTRLSLAKVLMQSPDLLLLDEPTNHLDLDALAWLEGYLNEYKGAIILVSHDRFFLDRVCTGVVEILMGVAESYAGNYTAYMTQREARFAARTKAYELQQKEIERQEAIIAKYRQFNREKSIRAAESREKALMRMERLDRPQDEQAIRFSFRARRRSGREVMKVRDYSKSYADKQLFHDLHFDMQAGERVIIIGGNGTGKSTLLSCLVGRTTPDSGQVYWGTHVDRGYYEQRQADLSGEQTVLDYLWRLFPQLLQHQVRGTLGLFGYSGDDVYKPLDALSGGEKARLALAQLMLEQDNMLILDEPTNHLDADSREVLEAALLNYNGTVLAVSHDRYFINRLADRVMLLRDGELISYEGNYDDYLAAVDLANAPKDEEQGITRTEKDRQQRLSREEKRRLDALKAALKDAEREVARLEEALAQAEASQADPAVYADPVRAAETARLVKELGESLEGAYEDWQKAEDALLSASPE